jgi:uncharacterized protein
MKLELSTWPNGTTTRDSAETPESLGLAADMHRFAEPVQVHLSVQKSDDEVVLSGRIATHVIATCVRCLDQFEIGIDETVRRVANVVPDNQVVEDTGDPDFVFLPMSLPVWDLSDVLREVALLALSEKPLCRDDCKGLCPSCGANLNHETCPCQRTETKGTLSQLSELLERRDSRSATGDQG